MMGWQGSCLAQLHRYAPRTRATFLASAVPPPPARYHLMNISELHLHYRSAACSIYYDAELPGSYTLWHGFASSADFRAACLSGLELAREHRTFKGISDARQMRVISLADQKWFTDELLPMIMELHISPVMYSAVVVPSDFFGRQSLDSLAEQVDDTVAQQFASIEVVTRYFDNDDDAYRWLKGVDAAARPHADRAAPQAEAA